MENAKTSNKRRMSFLDKVRNMSDEEFSKFKEDFPERKFLENTGNNIHQNPIHNII